jgi:hypothetical protein
VGILFAQTVLVLWIPFTFYVFKRFPVPKAALICFLGGILILPNYVGIKLPLFPEIGKTSMVNLAMLMALRRLPPGKANPRVERWWYYATGGTIVSLFFTGYTNQDPLVYGSVVIPGHNFKDTMYLVISGLLTAVPASYLGMRCFKEARDLKLILIMLAGSGLIYTLPIMIEVRMSPQFHVWVYGIGSPHEWGQAIRYGGYRPMVMTGHGLVLSLYMLGPAVGAFALWRAGARVWKFGGSTASWIMVFALVLCKSTGVWFYSLFTLPMVRWSKAQAVMRLATILIVITCLYPSMRANHWLPIDTVLDYAGKVSAERRQSLEFRFDNEDILLVKALMRPWFGWGGYGRARVYDQSGVDICITDGIWILTLGAEGFVGFIFYYMYLVFPVFILRKRLPRIRDVSQRNMLAAIALMCSVMWFDTLPNAPTFLCAQFFGGAICSISYNILAEQRRKAAEARQQRMAAPLAAPAPLASAAAAS